MIGSLLWAYYQTYPDRMPTVALKGDAVFPYFMASAMPKGVTGFILAGLCASAMSGLAAALNTIGAVAVSDFYLRFARHPSERRQLLISRSVVTALAFLSLLCAWALTFWEGGIMRFVLDVLTQVAALVVGGATGMFLLGLMTRRASPRGIYIGLVAGILFTTWAILTGNPAAGAVSPIMGWTTGRVASFGETFGTALSTTTLMQIQYFQNVLPIRRCSPVFQ
jgi:SSS family solute:Na+ symporter